MVVDRKIFSESEAKAILKSWEIPVPKYSIAKDAGEAINAANNIGYPVVIKIISRDILHKTEAGGVKIGLKNAQDVEDSFNNMIFEISDNHPTAIIEGFLIEKMADKGLEVIVGGLRDEQFGPAVMFGLGGITVELQKDISFRLAPVTKKECIEMMKEIKGYPLLTGYRGGLPVDVDAIADIIIKIGNIMTDMNNIKEIEINPLIVYSKGVMAVDARMNTVVSEQ